MKCFTPRPRPAARCAAVTSWLAGMMRRVAEGEDGAAPQVRRAAFDEVRRLLDDLGGLEQDRLGEGQPEGPGDPEVDDEVEGGGLLDREVGRAGALEDLVDVGGGAP